MHGLTTLEQLADARAPRVSADLEAAGSLDGLAAVRRRNAAGDPFDQAQLKHFLEALVAAYGYRPDYQGATFPKRVPYVPLPFAAEMVSYFRVRGDYFLKKSIPENTKQPTFIRRWLREAEGIVGEVRRRVVTVPNEASYEDAPAAVAAKAPDMYKPEVPAGQPHPKVLTAPATWKFFDALYRLAVHFDTLDGTPTKLDMFVEVVGERTEELAGQALGAAEQAGEAALDALSKVPDAARALWNAPGQALHAGKEILTIAAVVGVGILALWAVSR